MSNVDFGYGIVTYGVCMRREAEDNTYHLVYYVAVGRRLIRSSHDRRAVSVRDMFGISACVLVYVKIRRSLVIVPRWTIVRRAWKR